ncbi:hypothetical protein ACFX19_002794 [Malus domestica]|uniref:Disease resistance N-terminal domain-containing protein n=1 Tax=Malus domestica TaxID=3750 RepID=A0A498IXX8_MALDO|nr:hypothetical protein DVH24_037601 [Malus domestica]
MAQLGNQSRRMDMAEISSFTAKGILAKAASLSNEPFIRSWELEEKLKSLHQTLTKIQDIMREVAEKPQDPRDEEVASWVQKLKDVANDVDDVLEEINYEVLHHKHEIQNHLKRKSHQPWLSLPEVGPPTSKSPANGVTRKLVRAG